MPEHRRLEPEDEEQFNGGEGELPASPEEFEFGQEFSSDLTSEDEPAGAENVTGELRFLEETVDSYLKTATELLQEAEPEALEVKAETVSEMTQALTELVEQMTSLANSRDVALQSAENALKYLDLENQPDVSKVKAAIEIAGPLLKTAKVASAQLKYLEVFYSKMLEQRSSKILADRGFGTDDDLTNYRHELRTKAWELHRDVQQSTKWYKGFGIFNRNKVAALRAEVKKVYDENKTLEQQVEVFYSSDLPSYSGYASSKSWEITEASKELLKLSERKILEHYQWLLKEVPVQEVEPVDLDPKHAESLDQDFIDQVFLPEANRLRNLMSRWDPDNVADPNKVLNQADIQQAEQLLRKYWEVSRGVSSEPTWAGDHEQALQDFAHGIDQLPRQARDLAKGFVHAHPPSWPDACKIMLNLVQTLPANQSRIAVEDAYRKTISRLGSLPDLRYSNKWELKRDIDQLDQQTFWKQSQKLFKFNDEQWKLFRSNQQTPNFLDQAKVEVADRYLARIRRDIIVTSDKGKLEPSYIKGLMDFHYPEHIPVCIASWYNSRFGEDHDNALLGRHIASFNDEELSELAKQNIPGLMEAIKIIQESKGTFYLPAFDEGDPGTSYPNPEFEQFEQQLIEMYSYYLGRPDLQPQEFTLRAFENLSVERGAYDWSKLYEEAEKILTESHDYKVAKKTADLLLRIAEVGYEAPVDVILRTKTRWDKPESARYGRWLALAVLKSGDRQAEHLEGIANMIGATTEELTKMLDFMDQIREYHPLAWHNFYDAERFESFFALAQNPNVLPAIRNLVEYGYEFDIEHAQELLQVADRADEIIDSIERVRKVTSSFKYNLLSYSAYDVETNKSEVHFRFEPYDLVAQRPYPVGGYTPEKKLWLEACRQFKPSAIIDEMPKSKEEFLSLPEEEKEKIINDYIKAFPVKIVDKIAEIDLSEAQRTSLVSRLVEGRFDVERLATLFNSEQPFDRGAILLGILFSGDSTVVHTLHTSLQPEEYTAETQTTVHQFLSTKALPSEYNQYTEELGRILPAGTKLPEIPWGGMLQRLTKVQGQSGNAEHDPWKTDLDPLIYFATSKNILSRDNAKDGEIIFDYVQEYGMYNLPTLLEWHAAITKAREISDIPESIRADMNQTLNIQVEDLPNKGFVTKEIKKFRDQMQADLIADKTPKAIFETQLGLELFASLKGSTNWSEGGSSKDIIKMWVDTAERNPELAALPEGYQEVSFEVPVARRKQLDASEETAIAEKQNKILKNPELSSALEKLESAYQEALPIRGLAAWWEQKKAEMLREIDSQITAVEAKIASAKSEKAKSEMEKQKTKWAQTKDAIETLVLPDVQLFDLNAHAETELVEAIEKLHQVLPPKISGREHLLRTISAAHAFRVMGEGQRGALMDQLSRNSEAGWAKKDVVSWRAHLNEYLGEHYLNPNQEESHIGHTPFSQGLLKELQIVWGTKDLKKNIINQKDNELKVLESGALETTTENTTVTLVPARGILRVFSGDLGDACFTSKQSQLARGEYPGLTSFTFVTDRGTKKEKLAGSVLAIETTTPDGDTVLLVRANNPQENLIQKVDAEVLIAKTLEEMKALAKRRGIDHVVVPRDIASASSSNRKPVAEYYARHFKPSDAIPLTNEPATNFNGYSNWNSQGEYRSVKIN